MFIFTRLIKNQYDYTYKKKRRKTKTIVMWLVTIQMLHRHDSLPVIIATRQARVSVRLDRCQKGVYS